MGAVRHRPFCVGAALYNEGHLPDLLLYLRVHDVYLPHSALLCCDPPNIRQFWILQLDIQSFRVDGSRLLPHVYVVAWLRTVQKASESRRQREPRLWDSVDNRNGCAIQRKLPIWLLPGLRLNTRMGLHRHTANSAVVRCNFSLILLLKFQQRSLQVYRACARL